MSSEATNWVRDFYDGPAAMIGILFVIASYTDREGRGCRASIETLAAGANKGVRQVKKDLAMLRKEGVIALGDQRLVAHLTSDRRPVVYDLPGVMSQSVQRRGVVRDTPRGVVGNTPRGVVQGHDGVSYTTPKTSPTGRDRAARASGSAPRHGAQANPPCPLHAGQRTATCGPCRSERIAGK
jgi:hypothetical protein